MYIRLNHIATKHVWQLWFKKFLICNLPMAMIALFLTASLGLESCGSKDCIMLGWKLINRPVSKIMTCTEMMGSVRLTQNMTESTDLKHRNSKICGHEIFEIIKTEINLQICWEDLPRYPKLLTVLTHLLAENVEYYQKHCTIQEGHNKDMLSTSLDR